MKKKGSFNSSPVQKPSSGLGFPGILLQQHQDVYLAI